jgi:hypothetical protein
MGLELDLFELKPLNLQKMYRMWSPRALIPLRDLTPIGKNQGEKTNNTSAVPRDYRLLPFASWQMGVRSRRGMRALW